MKDVVLDTAKGVVWGKGVHADDLPADYDEDNKDAEKDNS